MPYTKTVWVDGSAPAISAANLNNIEDGVANAYAVGGTDVAVTDGGTGASDAATARTNLGLGTIATQAASSVAITGGSIAGITDLAVADGGTGASSVSAARTNLLLAGTPATSLPSSPSDGQQSILTDSTTAPTYAWLFQYSSTASKWFFIGGTPLYAEVTDSQSTASSTYAALGTAGPTVTTPRAGDYVVDIGARISIGTGGNGYMSYDIGATGAVDGDAAITSLANSTPTVMRRRRKTGLSASVALTGKYRNDASLSTTFANRWISILPISVT